MTQKISQHISKAILNAHVHATTYVPGFGANQVAGEMNSIKHDSVTLSYHEEVAFSISLGAAIAGKRSAALLKTHGIAKAANAIVDSLSCGVNAGFVVLVFDDKDGAHSDNIFDAESMIKGLRIPYKKIKGNNAYASVHKAFLESEKLKLPFLLLFDAEYVLEEYPLEQTKLDNFKGNYKRDLKQHLVVPPLAKYQYDVLNAKLDRENRQSIPEPLLPRTDQIPDHCSQPSVCTKSFTMFLKITEVKL